MSKITSLHGNELALTSRSIIASTDFQI